MRIAVLCLASRSGGGLTVLKDLHAFACTDPSNDWLFLLSDQDLGPDGNRVRQARVAPQYRGWLSRSRAEIFAVGRLIRQFDPGVLLSLQNADTPRRGRRPLAVYMHQSLPFYTSKPSLWSMGARRLAAKSMFLRPIIGSSIKRSAVTFVQTGWIKDVLHDRYPRVRIVKLGYPLEESRIPPEGAPLDADGFIYPAVASVYKDHVTLRKAVAQLHKQIPEAGRVTLTITRAEFESVAGRLRDDEVAWYRFSGVVPRDALFEVYRRSILVFPSFIETLGLPLYEARAIGCRVVAADTPFAREALGGYPLAHFSVPRDSESLARAMASAWFLRGSHAVGAQTEMEDLDSGGWKLMLDELQNLA